MKPTDRFNYRAMLAAIRPDVAERIGITEQPGLFTEMADDPPKPVVGGGCGGEGSVLREHGGNSGRAAAATVAKMSCCFWQNSKGGQ